MYQQRWNIEADCFAAARNTQGLFWRIKRLKITCGGG
jgi:hypothetical protein